MCVLVMTVGGSLSLPLMEQPMCFQYLLMEVYSQVICYSCVISVHKVEI